MSRTGPGTVLAGRYRVERLLGEGAAGSVWLVRDTRHKGLVWALKELDFSSVPATERDETRKLFDREATMLMQLSHPCLPRVVERFSVGDREYLVMERVEGPTLESIYRSAGGPIPEHDVAGWGAQICEVLEYLHGLEPPVVYRDLKPSNVMINMRGPIKLVDFGIARTMNPSRPGDTTAYGTPGFAPPEQYLGRATPQSDLYALGATLYQLLTRADLKPFAFDHPAARSLNPDVSPEMSALLARLMATEPTARPTAALEVRQQLLRLSHPRPWLFKAMGRLEHWLKTKRRPRG
ncbi:MAG: serine/threonine-protein kinase [Candidatus Eremiobacterota bacterium]